MTTTKQPLPRPATPGPRILARVTCGMAWGAVVALVGKDFGLWARATDIGRRVQSAGHAKPVVKLAQDDSAGVLVVARCPGCGAGVKLHLVGGHLFTEGRALTTVCPTSPGGVVMPVYKAAMKPTKGGDAHPTHLGFENASAAATRN